MQTNLLLKQTIFAAVNLCDLSASQKSPSPKSLLSFYVVQENPIVSASVKLRF